MNSVHIHLLRIYVSARCHHLIQIQTWTRSSPDPWHRMLASTVRLASHTARPRPWVLQSTPILPTHALGHLSPARVTLLRVRTPRTNSQAYVFGTALSSNIAPNAFSLQLHPETGKAQVQRSIIAVLPYRVAKASIAIRSSTALLAIALKCENVPSCSSSFCTGHS